MSARLPAAIRQHSLVSLFALAYAITWLGWIPFALSAWPVPMLPFGPLVAALIVAVVTGGWQGTKTLLLRMLQWRVAPAWYAFAIVLPVAITLGAAYGAVVAFGASDPAAAIVAALPAVLPGFALMMLNPLQGSLGEELAWRGFALPRLMSGRSPLIASLVLGALWAAWHAPLFITGLYGDVWLRIGFIVACTVPYTVLYRATGGSVLLAMLFHTGWNLAPEIVLASFNSVEVQHAMTLYLLGGITVSLLVTALAWPRLTRPRQITVAAPAAAPAVV